jgi:hypothetical protein
MIGARCKAFHHEVQQPRQADAHRAAHATQGEALAQQVFNIRASLGSNEALCGASAQLAFALFTQMMLFAMAGMAIVLVPG